MSSVGKGDGAVPVVFCDLSLLYLVPFMLSVCGLKVELCGRVFARGCMRTGPHSCLSQKVTDFSVVGKMHTFCNIPVRQSAVDSLL